MPEQPQKTLVHDRPLSSLERAWRHEPQPLSSYKVHLINWGVSLLLGLVPTAHVASQEHQETLQETTEVSSLQRTEASPPSQSVMADQMLATAPEIPPAVVLAPGHLHSLSATEVQRVALGDPDIADVTIVSPTQILMHAKKVGSTTLILWDAQGQHEVAMYVVDPQPQAVGEEVRRLLAQLTFDRVDVKLEGGKVFLLGEVDDDDQMKALEQMASTFPDTVVNLVRVKPTAAAQAVGVPAAATVPLVKLAVQVVEVNRTDLEKLGVKWSESIGFADAELTNQTTTQALFHWGTSVSRTSAGATLNALVRQNKARILSEPKLVTSSGKEASSFIGLDVPILTATSFSTTTAATSASIEFRKTGVLLTMTPNVIMTEAGQRITTIIQAEISGVDDSVALQVPVGSRTVSVPGFKVRKANTEVSTRSGETIMIAGLLEAEDTRNVDQVPALGSLPVLGRLFRSPEMESTRRELVIAVTPELVKPENAASTSESSASSPTSSMKAPQASATSEASRTDALEQAFAIAQVMAPVQDPTLQYALQVQEHIAKAIHYPPQHPFADREGHVKLRVHLLANGALKEALIAESSGSEVFDQEALRSARSQAPYPPFPPTISQQDLWLDIPILFRP